MEPNTQQQAPLPQMPLETPSMQPVISPMPQQRSKKPLLFAAGGVLIALLLATGGITLWASSAQKSYSTATAAYKQAATAEFQAMQTQPDNTEEYLVYLEKHNTTLGTIVNGAPKKQTILWASGASSTDATSVQALTTALNELRAAVQQYRTFLVYRDSLLLAVKDGGGSVSTPDNMRTALTKLQKTQKDIQALTPPAGLEDHRKTVANSYNAPIADIQAALAAYDKGNMDTYTKEVTELAESAKQIRSIGQLGDELVEMHQYYDTMSEKYAILETIVAPKGR